jgi:hypothetical protein
MQDHNVPDGLGQLPFTGDLLYAVSTRTAGRGRWTDLALYRRAAPGQALAADGHGDATGDYIVCSVGASVIYHRDGGCARGARCLPVPDASLVPDAMPCLDCWPAGVSIAYGEMVRPEADRPQAAVHVTPEQVEATLRQWSSVRLTAPRLSGPAQDLLVGAARKDAGIRRLLAEKT